MNKMSVITQYTQVSNILIATEYVTYNTIILARYIDLTIFINLELILKSIIVKL